MGLSVAEFFTSSRSKSCWVVCFPQNLGYLYSVHVVSAMAASVNRNMGNLLL